MTSISLINSGGYGEIYQNSPTTVIKRHFKTKRWSFNSFVREADIMLRLGFHPYLMGIKNIDVLEQYKDKLESLKNINQLEDDIFCFILNKASQDLNEFIYTNQTRRSETDIKKILLQLSLGIEFLHKMYVIHGDIKPNNILITGKNPIHVKITDFGNSDVVMKNNYRKIIVGTNSYLAPECLFGNVFFDDKIDVWSLGCVFYELLFSEIFNDVKVPQRKNQNSYEKYACYLENILNILDPSDEINIIAENLSKYSDKIFHHSYDKIMKNERQIQWIKNTEIRDVFNSKLSVVSLEIKKLLLGMLSLYPSERLSIEEVINSEYFSDENSKNLIEETRQLLKYRFLSEIRQIDFPYDSFWFNHFFVFLQTYLIFVNTALNDLGIEEITTRDLNLAIEIFIRLEKNNFFEQFGLPQMKTVSMSQFIFIEIIYLAYKYYRINLTKYECSFSTFARSFSQIFICNEKILQLVYSLENFILSTLDFIIHCDILPVEFSSSRISPEEFIFFIEEHLAVQVPESSYRWVDTYQNY